MKIAGIGDNVIDRYMNMGIIEAQDYKDMSRKAANVISAQMILKP